MTARVSVLLVEDNDADARYVEELFREPSSTGGDRFPGLPDAGDEVAIRRERTVAAAVEALESDGEAFDAILLDLNLDDSRGLDTLERVLETTRQVPVIVLTGMDDAVVGAAAIRAGAQDFLVKDEVTQELLERTVRHAIQRHETEQELRDRTEALEIMNQLTRHDVRNDVSLVVGRAAELREAVDDRHADTLREIITASNHVLQLTRTVGDAIETVADTESDSLVPVEVGPSIEREIEKARDLHESATIELRGDDPDVEVWADSLLSSVFGNVLSNAMLYNDRESPTVEIEVTVEPDTVTVAVADDGPGISPRQRRQLFSSESSDLSGSGLGIGLYLVRRLVDRYGGTIDIEDNEPRGTVLSIEFERV